MSNHQSNDRWMLEMFSFSVALIGLPLPRLLLKGPFTEAFGHRASRRQSICRFSFTHLTHLLNSFELDLVMSLLIYWLRLPRSSRVSQTLSVYTRQGDTGKWIIRTDWNATFSNWFQQMIPNDSSKWVRQMSLATEFSALQISDAWCKSRLLFVTETRPLKDGFALSSDS